MKILSIFEEGIVEVGKQEIEELCNTNVEVDGDSCIFEITNNKDFFKYLMHAQAPKHIGIYLNKAIDADELDLSEVSLKDYFTNESSFKIEVLNIKGNDNRIAISKGMAKTIFNKLKDDNIDPSLEMKNPTLKILVYKGKEHYYVALDFFAKELNTRDYRLFANSGSFKGDLAYYFMRKTGLKKDDNLLVIYSKDGVIGIEAAIWQNMVNLYDIREVKKNFSKISTFADFDYNQLKEEKIEVDIADKKIFMVDDAMNNILSARKNCKIANIYGVVSVQKEFIDDLADKFQEEKFDVIIIKINKKDEDKINEIYSQAKSLLKTGGRLLMLGRDKWEPVISRKFNQVEFIEISKGGNIYRCWILEKQ